MRKIAILTMPALLLGLAGCGDAGLKRVPVQGKLTALGQPVELASVQFIPVGATLGPGGIGISDGHGDFTVTSMGARGLVPGDYKVRVSRLLARDGTLLPPNAKQADNPGCKETVPKLYSSVDSTPLTATIPGTGGTLTIDIPEEIGVRK